DLYAGGWFDTAGGVTVNYIARWDGSSWSALGSGMNSSVLALAVSGSDLYAGGNFSTAGGVSANRVAKWDGSSWSALGGGMDNAVSALAVSGSDLYAGGNFTRAGEVTVNRIAKWDGSSWSALGAGMNSRVNALAVIGSDLYAGGYFGTAGGKPSSRFARWDMARSYGSLQVTIEPADAVTSGAQWNVDDSAWQNSGVALNLLTGTYTLKFKPVNGWTTPGSKSVNIQANTTTYESGTYEDPSVWQSEIVNWGKVYYGSNWYKNGKVRKPGASKIRLHFSEINLEPWYDNMYSSAGDHWTGLYNNVTTLEMSGDTMELLLQSDWSVSGYFVIDRVEWHGTAAGAAIRSGELFAAAFGPPTIFTKAYDDNTGVRTYPPEGYSERGSFHVGPASGVDAAYDYFGNGFSSGWLAMAFNAKETSPPVRMLAAYDDETGAARPIPAGYAQQGAFHISQGCTDYDGVTMTRGWLAMLYRTDLALPPMKMVIGLDDETGWSEPRPPGYTNKGAMHVNQGGACYYNLIMRSGWLEMWYRNDYLLTADQGAFNIYVADKPTTVTGMGAPFVSPDDDASQAIFKIYVFNGDLGKTTLIGLSDIVDVEPGASWCESGDMEIGLEPGRLYAIGVVWTGQAQIEGALPISSLSKEVVGVPAGSSLVSSPAEEQVGDQVFSAVKADKIYPMLIELEKAPVDVTPAVLDDSLY
ncbi:MAG: hypothetical protein WCK47_07785, partial [bacterium]